MFWRGFQVQRRVVGALLRSTHASAVKLWDLPGSLRNRWCLQYRFSSRGGRSETHMSTGFL